MVQKTYLYKILRYGLILIIVAMPFHALLTTWAGSNFGHLLAIRAWKEVLLLVLTIVGLYYFATDNKLRSVIWARLVNKLILAYALWIIFIALISTKDYDSLSQGLAIDLRFLVAFVLAQVVLHYQPISKKTLTKIIILPSVGVVLFGKLQIFLLSKNFLEWFGYNKKTTIPPYFTIDEQQNKLRYASTLSGPNTLGAYLVLPLTLCLTRFKKLKKNRKLLLFTLIYLVAVVTVLYSSHSRSAWLASIVSVGIFLLLKIPKKYRYVFVSAAAVLVLLSPLILHQFRNTSFIEDVVLHDNPVEGGEVSSNSGHLMALKAGATDVYKSPLLGCGVGCAGPASVRHSGGTKIAENYYLQIAQETGVVGLGLLATIIFIVLRELFKKRSDDFALVMFASLIGLSVANLILHTWADDTLAYIWWFSASVVLYSNFSKT